jgi:hypothetical protein
VFEMPKINRNGQVEKSSRRRASFMQEKEG